MPLALAEGCFAERVRNLGVDPSVLNVLMAEVVGDVLDAAAGIEKVDRD
jgi:hypothetical protein